MEFKEKDRVVLKDIPNWTGELMRFNKSRRAATVEKVFTPIGRTTPVVRVRFDMRVYKYKDSGVYFMSPGDLVLETAE